ncbi:MAG: RimK family alpha-L-glutamate ligase [Haloferacaceae archaeon]
MLRLAMTTRAETFERVRDPLADRGIRVEHVPTDERTVGLTDPGGEWDGFDAGFVYPSRPMEGGVADALLSVPWVNDREAVLTSRNKAHVYAALARAGLPVPETTLVSNPADEGDVVAAARDLGFPLVVKPTSTTRGVGVARAGDVDSLLGVVDYLNLLHEFPATGDRSFLLQRYVPEARDYRAMVIDGAYAGAVERRLPDEAVEEGRWKHNVHRGAEATGVDLPPPARDLAERTAAALGIDYLGVDLLAVDAGGDDTDAGGDDAVDTTDDRRWLVNETNARPTVDEATKYEPGFYDRLAALIRRTAERSVENG